MEEILRRINEVEKKLAGDIQAKRTEVSDLKRINLEHVAAQSEFVATRSDRETEEQGSRPHFRNAYRIHRGVIPHPRSSRTSSQSSFIAVGKTLHAGIETHNEMAESKGVSKINQMDASPKAFTRNAMSTLEIVLGASPLFKAHLGSMTLQEIKSHYTYSPQLFQQAHSDDVIKRLERELPILEIASGHWAARELIRGKLINMKEAKKKGDHIWDSDLEDSDYVPSSDVDEEDLEMFQDEDGLDAYQEITRVRQKKSTNIATSLRRKTKEVVNKEQTNMPHPKKSKKKKPRRKFISPSFDEKDSSDESVDKIQPVRTKKRRL